MYGAVWILPINGGSLLKCTVKQAKGHTKITKLILTDRDMLEGRDIAMQKVRRIVKMCVFFLVSLDEF